MLCFLCACVSEGLVRAVGDYIDSLVAGWVMMVWYMSDCVILVCVCVCARVNIRHLKHTHTATPPPPSTFAFRRCRRRNPAGVYALRSRARNCRLRGGGGGGVDALRAFIRKCCNGLAWLEILQHVVLCWHRECARSPARKLMCISCCTSTTVCNCVSVHEQRAARGGPSRQQVRVCVCAAHVCAL